MAVGASFKKLKMMAIFIEEIITYFRVSNEFQKFHFFRMIHNKKCISGKTLLLKIWNELIEINLYLAIILSSMTSNDKKYLTQYQCKMIKKQIRCLNDSLFWGCIAIGINKQRSKSHALCWQPFSQRSGKSMRF